jgi:hypothetical protein
MPSEIATLRQQIEHEYAAAQLGLSGLASGTTRHRIITARQERIGLLHDSLRDMVGESAIMIVSDTLDRLPTPPTRPQVQQVLLQEFGESEDTTRLLTLIQSLWTQVDRLSARVGIEAACKLVSAPPTYTQEGQPS